MVSCFWISSILPCFLSWWEFWLSDSCGSGWSNNWNEYLLHCRSFVNWWPRLSPQTSSLYFWFFYTPSKSVFVEWPIIRMGNRLTKGILPEGVFSVVWDVWYRPITPEKAFLKNTDFLKNFFVQEISYFSFLTRIIQSTIGPFKTTEIWGFSASKVRILLFDNG